MALTVDELAARARELYRRARELADQRRFAQARRLLTEAAEAAPDADLRARIAGTTAYVLAQTGEQDEGEQLVRDALASPGISAHTLGVLAGQLGATLLYQGRLDEASLWLDRGIHALVDDPMAAANLRMNRSLIGMQQRDLAAATADLEAARDAYRQHGSPVDVAEAQHNLGYVALLSGDLVRAMREMGDARILAGESSAASAAIGDVDMAEALRDAGLTSEAEALLRRAARTFGANRMPQARAEAELQLARSLLRHDPVAAVRSAAGASRRFAALGSMSWAARADGVRLRARLAAGAIDRGGRIVPDRPVDLTEVAPVVRRLTAAGLAGEAAALRLSLELWRARHAEPGARMPALPASAPLEVRLLAAEVRAARAAGAGREAQARSAAAAGLDELSAWRAAFGSLDLQTSLSMYGMGLVLAGLGSAVRSGRPDAVFDWSERARHLSIQVLPLRPPLDPQQAAQLGELRALRADLASADWASDPRAMELADALRHRQWTTTGVAGAQERVDLAGAVAALDSDTAILSFVFSPEGLACLVVSVAGARVVPLPGWTDVRAAFAGLRADLDMSAMVRTGPLVDVVARSLAGRVERLSTMLLDEPLQGVDARRIVLTAPGVLSGMPWAMLPALRGRAFTVAGSVSRWVHARGARRPLTGGVAFAVGPRVARGAEEAAAGAAAWTAPSVLTEGEATVDAVAAAASTVDVLHIAAHGRHAVDNPIFSGLQLADGVLFGYDIDRMPQLPGTVVLSACETGRSSVRWGEEAVGMTRAWLHAGAGAVVAAPVAVADDAACELLGAVHAELAVGSSPAEALAAAAGRTGIVAPFHVHGNGF